jgi:protein-tyrosine phosphatase
MTELLTELPYGFKGKIIRSPLPYSPLFDPDMKLINDYLEAAVDVVVMLTPDEEVWEVTRKKLKQIYKAHEFDVIYVPVEDFSIPSPGDFQGPIRRVLHAAEAGENVVIHCQAGLGRTGMFAACLAKAALEMDGEEAVRWVRQFVPEAVQTAQQFRFVENFDLMPEDA